MFDGTLQAGLDWEKRFGVSAHKDDDKYTAEIARNPR